MSANPYEETVAKMYGGGTANPYEATVAAMNQSPPSQTYTPLESAGMGAIQGGTLGFGDEMAAGGEALGRKLYDVTHGDGGQTLGDTYRTLRDRKRAEYDAAKAANPKSYLAGQVVGGAPVATAIGAAAAPAAGVAGLMGSGAAFGGTNALGESKADLTKGDAAGAAADTAGGALIGAATGLAGAGVAKGIQAARGVFAKMSEDAMIKGLGKYLNGIIERNGSPEALKAGAGKIIQRAVDLAGDAPVAVNRFTDLADTLAKESRNPFGDDLNPVTKMVIGKAEEMAQKGSATLGEIQEGLKFWTRRASELKNDPAGQRIAILAKKALAQQLGEATGDETIGKAASMLVEGRAQYAAGKSAEALKGELLKAMDPLSEGGEMVGPRKLALLYTGKNKARIDKIIGNDEDARASFEMAINAARELAKKGDTWLPEHLEKAMPPALTKSFRTLMKNRDVIGAFTVPEAAAAFRQLVTPARSLTTEQASGLIAKIYAAIETEPQLGQSPAMAEQNRQTRLAASDAVTQ